MPSSGRGDVRPVGRVRLAHLLGTRTLLLGEWFRVVGIAHQGLRSDGGRWDET